MSKIEITTDNQKNNMTNDSAYTNLKKLYDHLGYADDTNSF